MKIRELLQIEIWSKRKSRAIVVVSVFLVVGFAPLYLLNRLWLTPAEREAARNALLKIDSLQIEVSSGNNEDFGAKKLNTEGTVEVAERVALTARDKRISSDLTGYLITVELRRLEVQTRRLKWRNSSGDKPFQQLDSQLSRQGSQERSSLAAVLYSELDK